MSRAPLPPDAWSPDVHARLLELIDLTPGDEPHLAVLDWDDTVIAGDISLAMLRRSDAIQGTRWHDSYYDLLRDHGRDVAYPQVIRWYAGWTPEAFARFAEDVIDDALSTGEITIREPMRSLIDALRDRDWRVHVVTASPQLLVGRMARRLGFCDDDVIGLRLKLSPDGTWTDELDGHATYAEGKRHAILDRFGRAPTFVAGDSSSDLAMMHTAAHVLVVDGHDAELRRTARAKGWMLQGGWAHTRAEPGVVTE